MSFTLHSFTPICRRRCLPPFPTLRSASTSARSIKAVNDRPPRRAPLEPSAGVISREPNPSVPRAQRTTVQLAHAVPKPVERNEEMARIDQERRMIDIASRRDSPLRDPMNPIISMPLLAIRPPVSRASLKNVPWRGWIRWHRDWLLNPIFNWLTMFSLARRQLIPLTDYFDQPKDWDPYLKISPWKVKVWLEPLRKQALKTYIEVNEAIASGNMIKLREICQNEFVETATSRVRNKKDDTVAEWQYHGEASPVEILSIREAAIPTLSINAPEVTMVHVLLKFDTMQTLIVRPKRRPPSATHPEPKRVVEYLVMEGRMNPGKEFWRFKMQLYDDPAPYLRADVLNKRS